MSHGPVRKETNCLNCDTALVGRFCHNCGQENLEPKETAWHLVTHFFNDITHFDGKFFKTLKILLFRPGFLSREYMNGRRAAYLNPIRMYVFTSAIFFLMFFSFLQPENVFKASFNGKTFEEIDKMDSASFATYTAKIDKAHKPMTREQFRAYIDTTMNVGIHFEDNSYHNVKEYDSLIASGKRTDGWIARQFVYKQIAINEKYHNNSREIFEAFTHAMLHSIPQMLFFSLPLLALILKLLYIRRKQFYYVSHGIFAIHFYVFLFIGLLILFSLFKAQSVHYTQFLSILTNLLVVALFVYEYIAMKNFYRQGWIKTFFKFFLANILFIITLSLLFVAFIFFSFFNI